MPILSTGTGYVGKPSARPSTYKQQNLAAMNPYIAVDTSAADAAARARAEAEARARAEAEAAAERERQRPYAAILLTAEAIVSPRGQGSSAYTTPANVTGYTAPAVRASANINIPDLSWSPTADQLANWLTLRWAAG
jgi:hypothetical protein